MIEHHHMALRFLKYSALDIKAQFIEEKLIAVEKAREREEAAKATEKNK